MKRKLIRQGGGGGLTLYVPKKWVDREGLRAGDEVEIEEADHALLLSPKAGKKQLREITIDVTGAAETAIRTLLVNPYRTGYDRIIVTYKGDYGLLSSLVSRNLLGFEITSSRNNLYIIESVAEPQYEDFENLVERQLFMLLELMKSVPSTAIQENAERVQKYDNFLRRAIAKRIYETPASQFLWPFLSSIVQISRYCFYLNKYLLESKAKLSGKEAQFMIMVCDMLELLQKAYLSKKYACILKMHEMNEEMTYKLGYRFLKSENPIVMHYLLSITRLVYTAGSPVTAIMQVGVIYPGK